MRDYYAILGVPRDASLREIKRAYRRLVHRYHPDKNPQDGEASRRFRDLTEAYETLRDPRRRGAYDRTHAPRVDPEEVRSDVASLFRELFGDFYGAAQRTAAKEPRRRRVVVEVGLREALRGGVQRVAIEASLRCPSCTGTGVEPGTAPQLCRACGGRGEVLRHHGFTPVGERCPHCGGKGALVSSACRRCEGTGTVSTTARGTLRIPPASEDGAEFEVDAGEIFPEGAKERNAALTVCLRIRPDPLLEREGQDVVSEVPITLHEALFGGSIDVVTLDGPLSVAIPPGTQDGDIVRIDGRGVLDTRTGIRGDHLLRLHVELPSGLSDARRQALAEALEGLDGDRHYPRRRRWNELVARETDRGGSKES